MSRRAAKWQQLLSMDENQFNRLSEQEMRKAVRTLAIESGKRVRELESIEDDFISPALTRIRRSGGKISSSGKNLNQLRREFTRAAAFLKDQTSTAQSFKHFRADLEYELQKNGVPLTEAQYKRFWKAYNKLTEQHKDIENIRSFKYEVMRNIIEQVDAGSNPDEIVENFEKEVDGKTRLQEIYEKHQENDQEDSPSDFFDW